MGNINISTASVPDDYCPGDIKSTWPFLAGLLSADLTGNLNTFNYGADTPAPDDQDKPWLKLDASGNPDKWYVFANGNWVSRHPVAAGTIIIYDGAVGTIDTFDGGEAGAITATTGPMWERVTALDAKFPLGIGTLPSTTVVAVAGTGGVETHVLTREELPAERIPTESVMRTNVQDGGGADVYAPDTTTGSFVTNAPLHTEELGDGDAHTNMPPFYGVIFLRKTARTQYRI